ncbi:MAG: glycerophosphodiester phosphodiesterase [Actinobacteria bacterium]|nr:glycerophosphodiester phosphodiesterase [Actinomycetota bacterium]
MEAFALALRLGATGLESDVWRTADGKAVLDHDGVAGGRVRKRRIAEVDRADLPTHIPSLTDLFETCGTEYQLSLDIMDAEVVSEVIATARDVGFEDQLWLCHADADLLASWRDLSTRVRLVHSTRLNRLAGGPERHAARLEATAVDALNLHHSEWTGGLTTLVHRFERYALAWDAQFERVLDETLAHGVDAVFSDHVDLMIDALARARRGG